MGTMSEPAAVAGTASDDSLVPDRTFAEASSEHSDHSYSDAVAAAIRIRRLERQAEVHLPRAAQLPPVVGLPSVDAPVTSPNQVERKPRMLPPSLRRLSIPSSGVKISLIVGAIAAVLAYISALESSPPNTDRAFAPVIASTDISVIPGPPRQALPSATEAQRIPTGIGTDREVQTPSLPATRRWENGSNESRVDITAPPPTPDLKSRTSESRTTEDNSSTVPLAPVSEALLLSEQDIKALIDRGRRFFKAGDVAAARLVFSRAANAGDATAAIEMGMTYDLAALQNLGVRGLTANLEKAQSWYDRASKLRSSEDRSPPTSMTDASQVQR
jgi:hypothetical protein